MNSKGCSFLEEGIDFEFDKICDCCIMHNDGRGLPLLMNNYHGAPVDWEQIFDIKSKRVEAQKQSTIYDCEGCYRLSDYTFKNEKKISEFHFSHCRACNAKCIYCSEDYNNSSVNYDTYEVVKDLIDKGYYKSGGEATMEGGEPTLMQNFEKLVHLLTSHGTRIRVHTSGIKYSETVQEALKNNLGTVVISIDSSSRKTYKTIKRTDSFDKVCENIKKYAVATKTNPDNIVVKYIIVPGYNDNTKEIKNFFKLMKSLNVSTVALDMEVRYAMKYDNKDVSPHIYLLVDYFENQATKYGMNLLKYSFLFYVLKNRKIPKAKYTDNDFMFNLCYGKYVQKDKNLKYV